MKQYDTSKAKIGGGWMPSYDSIVIGGGFFGLYLSEFLAKQGYSVLLCEKEADLMQRASFANQARVHNGYHYPRSVLTALRSRLSFPRFAEEFKSCIDDTFQKYYMIGKVLGKVTAAQFERFCARIGAPCTPASSGIVKLTDQRLIEAVFETEEYAFDAVKLKEIMLDRIARKRIKLRCNTTVESVAPGQNHFLAVKIRDTDENDVGESVTARHVFNCTYSKINELTRNSGLPLIPLKHQVTEMCLVEVPEELRNVGITVMCGPFFSVMPFPARRLHSFSHVRYTPHFEWQEENPSPFSERTNALPGIDPPCRSAWSKIRRDAARYIPLLSDCRYQESIWEIKTILPHSETDDSRPILFKPNHGLQGFHCIMGGKIDNIYDISATLEENEIVPCNQTHSFQTHSSLLSA